MNGKPPPHPLLERSAQMVMFIMLRRTEDPVLLRERLTEHLEWMISEEKRGNIFLSGPVAPGDGPALHGLTIIQANSMAEAESIARLDPLIKSGAMTYSLHLWSINEGQLKFTINLSDSTVSL